MTAYADDTLARVDAVLGDPVAEAEQWAREVLDRPDQVNIADHTHLRTLLDSVRGYRAAHQETT